jgi:hypothetical protein
VASLWAEGKTAETGDAFVRIEKEIRPLLQGFGVVAPAAPKAASFKEYGSPDTGSVVYGAPLDIEYHTFSHI